MESNNLTSIPGLERSVDALRIDNNNGSGHMMSKDNTFCRSPLARVSSLEDVIEEEQGASSSVLRGRNSRSPRRRLEEESLIYSITQAGFPRLRNRRRSDPGRISVSPLRSRVRIDCDIAEDGDYENRNIPIASAGCHLPVQRSSSLDPTEIDEALPIVCGYRSRSRSPHTQIKMRTQRSRSLPGLEFEIGEAIGAIAVRQSQISPEPGRGHGVIPRRRRSVSVETGPLEAILEENAAASKASRRFSTPNVKSPPTL